VRGAWSTSEGTRPEERAVSLDRHPYSDYNVITLMTVKTRIVQIGNSRGIRVPKALLEQARLPEEVELQAEPGRLIVRGAKRPRAGWADAAQAMHARHEDQLLEEPTATKFDLEQWEWR